MSSNAKRLRKVALLLFGLAFFTLLFTAYLDTHIIPMEKGFENPVIAVIYAIPIILFLASVATAMLSMILE